MSTPGSSFRESATLADGEPRPTSAQAPTDGPFLLNPDIPFDGAYYGTCTSVYESHDPRPAPAVAWERRRRILEARQLLPQLERDIAACRSALADEAATPPPSDVSPLEQNRRRRALQVRLSACLLQREQALRLLGCQAVPLRNDEQAPLATLRELRFQLPSPEDVRRASVVPVVNKQMYTLDGDIAPQGPLDKRLGISDKHEICATCGQKLVDCIGHFGHIELVLPVYHMGYVAEVLHILQSICKSCGRVLLPPETAAETRQRLREARARGLAARTAALSRSLLDVCKRITLCPHCGAPNGSVRKVTAPREWLVATGASTDAARAADDGSRGVLRTTTTGIPGVPRFVHECRRRHPASRKHSAGARTHTQQHRQRLHGQVWQARGEPTRTAPTDDKLESELEDDEAPAPDLAPANRPFELTPLHVWQLLRRIPDDDAELFDMERGCSRPEDLLITALPVPPVCIRPSLRDDPAHGTREDDLTVQLVDILAANWHLNEQLARGSELSKLMETWDHLQLCVARYLYGETTAAAAAVHAKPQLGLRQRLRGKQGRFRGNLSGKRVDFSSRTVISPDPHLEVFQVGVPLRIARALTIPEPVTAGNAAPLRAAVLRGPEQHPGANFVLFPDGSKRFLKYGDRERVARALTTGCVVERHLVDDDVVLFNRQPSLHRLSIMAHRVRVMPGRTFRFNECVCAPYNADFDGDEMNLHVPQTAEARIEALELLSVVRNLNTPRNGEPLIACTQDFITALHLLTGKDVFYGRAAAMQCVAWATDACSSAERNGEVWTMRRLPEPAILAPVPLWTGKQLFTAVVRADGRVPPDSWRAVCCDGAEKAYSGHDGAFCPHDGYVQVRGGELLAGQVGKRTLGANSHCSLLYVLSRTVSAEAAALCMGRLARFAARWLSEYGFSFGVDDVRPGAPLERAKARLLRHGYRRVDALLADHRAGRIRPRPGCTVAETLESLINQTLSDLREQAGTLCLRRLQRGNAPMTMAMCGAKGSTINISQMVACVGQQTVGGTRVPPGFYRRTLPHFARGDQTPAAGGFVANSFHSGMSATEFFFHSMAGREGLVDTAVKTAETGYLQRRLMKALEDLRAEYDGTARTSDGAVVQFVSGGDGLDAAEMEGGGGGAVDWTRWLHTVRWMHPPEREPVVMDAEQQQQQQQQQRAGWRRRLLTLLPPSERRIAERALDAASPSLTVPQWRALTATARRQMQRARLQPGTAVGALAAQSVGEPSTQMTLKTFHFAGVASMNITQGVPRIKELMNAVQDIATPLVTVSAWDMPGSASTTTVDATAAPCELAHARQVLARLERVTLGQLLLRQQVIWQAHGVWMHLVLRAGVDAERLQRLLSRDAGLRLGDDGEGAGGTVQTWPDRRTGHLHLRIDLRGRRGADVDAELGRLKRLLPQVVLQGVPGVKRAVVSATLPGMALSSVSPAAHYHLLAETDDLRSLMNLEGVDARYVTCNHVLVTERVLGTEAARATIIHEMLATMASHGITVDARHVQLLADVMTCRGPVLGVTRFGIGRMRSSTLMLASFEKTVDHLFEAAVHGRCDPVAGVSECVIMGKPVPLGTGMFQVGWEEGVEVEEVEERAAKRRGGARRNGKVAEAEGRLCWQRSGVRNQAR